MPTLSLRQRRVVCVPFLPLLFVDVNSLPECLAASDHGEGASLHLAFRGLQEESINQGKLHAEAAKDLQTKIAEPFASWAQGYKVGNSLYKW